MRFTFEVLVTLKPGLADPQGKAVEASLPRSGCRTSRTCTWARTSGSTSRRRTSAEARAQVEEMASRLLSNPVIEEYRILGRPPTHAVVE